MAEDDPIGAHDDSQGLKGEYNVLSWAWSRRFFLEAVICLAVCEILIVGVTPAGWLPFFSPLAMAPVYALASRHRKRNISK